MKPRPTPDSDVDDPYMQKYTKECKQCKKKHGKYQCSKCNDDFHTLADYCNHIAKHEQIKFKCNICGKSSDSKRSLAVHIKHHTDRFPCQMCGKVMMSKLSLYNHHYILDKKTFAVFVIKHLKAENPIWIIFHTQ